MHEKYSIFSKFGKNFDLHHSVLESESFVLYCIEKLVSKKFYKTQKMQVCPRFRTNLMGYVLNLDLAETRFSPLMWWQKPE